MKDKYIALPKRAKDITGERFGRLVALGSIGKNLHNKYLWECQCDCGKTAVVIVGSLRSGRTASCGCLWRESIGIRARTHGMANTRIFRVWKSIIERCTSENSKAYRNYGGRGIAICTEWRHDFQSFYDFVSQLPNYGKKGYTIDRIDNDGNYDPSNVRLATRREQSRNTRTNRMIAFGGKEQCLKDWAGELNINRATLKSRLDGGWPIERALDPKRYGGIKHGKPK